MKALAILAAVSLLSVLAQGQVEKSGPWEVQSSGTTASLRGIHAVGGGVAWASGTNGTVLRTEDSGYMWQSCAMPPGAEKLDFRGIWAWDANTAIVMSSGPGDQSRLYKTTDGCSHWTLLYTNPDKDGFWDAVVFSDRNYGMLLGDPTLSATDPAKPGKLERTLTIRTTVDGGEHWIPQVYANGEITVENGTGAFAASNSALVIIGHKAWLGTGGKPEPHIFIGDSYGNSSPATLCDCFPVPPDQIWFTHHVSIPLASGTDSAGVFSLAFRDDQHGMAVGGDYTKPNVSAGTAAWTADGGQHWTAAEKPPHGYRSAVAWDADAKAWIAAGTNGTDISYDDGKTWQLLDDGTGMLSACPGSSAQKAASPSWALCRRTSKLSSRPESRRRGAEGPAVLSAKSETTGFLHFPFALLRVRSE